MKSILLIVMMGIGISLSAQTMEKEYVNHLLDAQKPKIQPHEWRMFPKPESIEKKGNKVIVVFDRKEFERFQYIRRKSHLNRVREFQSKPLPPYRRF
jgi:thioredoxin-related protein